MDEPISDSAIISSSFLSARARENGVKVMLSGAGGDEIFGGYNRYVYAKKMFGGGVTKKALGGALDLGAPLDVSGQQGATSSGKSSAGLGKGITGRRLGTKRRLGRRGPAVRRTKADDRGM